MKSVFATILILGMFVLPVYGEGSVCLEKVEKARDFNMTAMNSKSNIKFICGNGDLEIGEQCEYDWDCGNVNVCNGSCQCVSKSVGKCGDGILDEGEQCDDGNTSANDGCDTYGSAPNTFGECTLTRCGDGIAQSPSGYGGLEQCDNGRQCEDGTECSFYTRYLCDGIGDGSCNIRENDGCSSSCTLENNCDDSYDFYIGGLTFEDINYPTNTNTAPYTSPYPYIVAELCFDGDTSPIPMNNSLSSNTFYINIDINGINSFNAHVGSYDFNIGGCQKKSLRALTDSSINQLEGLGIDFNNDNYVTAELTDILTSTNINDCNISNNSITQSLCIDVYGTGC